MAYRFEGNELVLDGWERGISSGPYSIFSPSALGPINQTGTVDLSYGNILGVPGEFSVQFPLIASTVAGSPPRPFSGPIQFTTDYTGKDYCLDQNSQVWTTDEALSTNKVTWTYRGNCANSGTITVTNNGGCVWWQGYLLSFFGGKVYYSSDNGVTNTDWTSVVGAITSGNNYAISSKTANIVYFCNGSAVGSISLNPNKTFDPTDATTFTFQPSAVVLPTYDTAMCLGEINNQVLIGGLLNRVYPWDAQNSQNTGVTNLPSIPLFIGDRGVRRIVVVNSNAYIFSGIPSDAGTLIPAGRGFIYITNGSTIDVFAKMPDNFVSVGGTNSNISSPYWNFGDAIWHRNQLIFGAQAVGNISNTVIPDTGGVWGIDIASQALYRVNEMSTGSSALPFGLLPFSITAGTLTTPGLGYMVADFDGTTTGHFNNSSTALTTSARVISDKIPVGTKFIPKTFEQLELKMAVALVSGESVDVTLITDQDPSGISIGSMTSADGMSKVFTPLKYQSTTSVMGLQWLQVQCVLNPTSTNPTFVRLREIRLR